MLRLSEEKVKMIGALKHPLGFKCATCALGTFLLLFPLLLSSEAFVPPAPQVHSPFQARKLDNICNSHRLMTTTLTKTEREMKSEQFFSFLLHHPLLMEVVVVGAEMMTDDLVTVTILGKEMILNRMAFCTP